MLCFDPCRCLCVATDKSTPLQVCDLQGAAVYSSTASHNKTLQGCSEQIALEGQDLPRMYLAHHESESVIVSIIIKARQSEILQSF